MGIPSYYKFLTTTNGNIIKKTVVPADILFFDLNCIIYGCLHGKSMPVYTHETREEYEKKLLFEVCKYIELVWRKSGSPSEVFIAVDGVVPMAKMKQQRLRRFKAIVLNELEVQQQVRKKDDVKWDTNAITPGTLFMKKLNVSLNELCSRHNKWTVSGYDKCGEGEQKIMEYIRNVSNKSTCIIYGLDADLILLSLLHSYQHTLYLMREEMEFNRVVSEDFMFLDIELLKKELFKENSSREKILDYCMMMNFLGNDFIPHSVGFTIKENGYTLLLEELQKQKEHFIVDGKIDWNIVKQFLSKVATKEIKLFEDFSKKKKETKFYRINKQTASEYDIKMASVQILPCNWFVEGCLLYQTDWKNIYYKKFLIPERKTVIESYLKGFQWVMDYYIGNEIEYDYYYPWQTAPLWEDTVSYLSSTKPIIVYDIQKWLEPEEQLSIVLPKESYSLIQNKNYLQFPQKYPEYWPTKFGFHSLGKKWFYECESNIPIFSSKILRGILRKL